MTQLNSSMSNETDPLFQDPAQWTPRERVFAAMYLKTLNTSEASAACGMPYATCNLLLKKSHVNAYITAVLSAKIMSSLQVEANIGKIAGSSIDDLYDVSEGGMPMLNLNKARERGVMGNIKRITYDAEGRPLVETYDKLRAQELLAKRHGLLKEQVDISIDQNINITAVRATVRAAMADPERLAGMIAIAEELANGGAIDANAYNTSASQLQLPQTRTIDGPGVVDVGAQHVRDGQ